jgi:hypothetical protein
MLQLAAMLELAALQLTAMLELVVALQARVVANRGDAARQRWPLPPLKFLFFNFLYGSFKSLQFHVFAQEKEKEKRRGEEV